MNNVLRWAKTNPIALISILVSVGSIVFITYIVLFAAGSKLDGIAETAKKDVQQISKLERWPIEFPASDANSPPEETTGVANDNVIETLRGLYETLKGEFRKVLEAATQINRGERPEMLLAEGVLPKPGSTSVRSDARRAYPLILQKMLGVDVTAAQVEIDERWPSIEAGTPLDPKEIEATLAANRENLQSANPDGVSVEEYEQYVINQQKNLLSIMRNHASGMRIYVDSLDWQDTDAFPFQVRPLAQLGALPQDDELWESQLQLWILADVIAAIRDTNERESVNFGAEADDPETPGDEKLPPSPYNLPVKRLLSIDVLNGYVGLHSLGAVAGTGNTGGQSNGFDSAVSEARVSSDGTGPATLFQAPEGKLPGEGNNALPDNFYFGPAGRASNALYDVRHVRLIVHADFQRLPILLEQIAATNLSTVLSVQVTNVDEFQMFKEGYLYGENDTVEAEIVIETIWLRGWTRELMPQSVRDYLKIEDEKNTRSRD